MPGQAAQVPAPPSWMQGAPSTALQSKLAPVPALPIATAIDKLPVNKLTLPKGFNIEVYAGGLTNARSLRVDDQGNVYVSTRTIDKVYAVTDKNGAAVQLHRVFGLLFEHARLSLKWVGVNPVRDIKKPKSKNKDGHHTWTKEEVSAWRKAFPVVNPDGTPCMARRFLELALAWGARASDLLQLGWKNVDGGVVSFVPSKTRISTGKVLLDMLTALARLQEMLHQVGALDSASKQHHQAGCVLAHDPPFSTR